jgi:hypothetical protein
MPIIPSLKRVRQEDQKFKVSLGYITRPCLKIEREREADRQASMQVGRHTDLLTA